MRIKTAMALAAFTTAAVVVPAPANSATGGSSVDRWIEMHPQGERAAERTLLSYAKTTDQPADQAAEELLEEFDPELNGGEEVLSELVAAGFLDTTGLPGDGEVAPAEEVLARSSDGGGSNRVPIGDARARGDYFYHHSSTWGFNHGHVGMFRRKDVIIEAASAELGVRRVSSTARRVPVGETVLNELSGTPYSQRDAATEWANAQEGAAYRDFYSQNKTHSRPFNCSQLMWAAFDREGLDLDANSGAFVLPQDILQHWRSQPYRGV
ncbi:hypothetical protein [Nocardioides sp. SYSU D00065]|uniref:hypothetical protein n=1 Tax=Nocardioides sp. SYSU D00065 TaxID=2817378 RepID=UPI001B344AA5|nr:hypothetical protein [Nocardioides sp. SYSU D00065]